MEATLVVPEPVRADPAAYDPAVVEPEAGRSPAAAGIIDLFAGLGCVARGFAASELFDPLALIDVDEAARETYLHNFPGAPYRIADVGKLSLDELDAMRGGATIAGVLGCPPCQGLSAPEGGGQTMSATACWRDSSPWSS